MANQSKEYIPPLELDQILRQVVQAFDEVRSAEETLKRARDRRWELVHKAFRFENMRYIARYISEERGEKISHQALHIGVHKWRKKHGIEVE